MVVCRLNKRRKGLGQIWALGHSPIPQGHSPIPQVLIITPHSSEISSDWVLCTIWLICTIDQRSARMLELVMSVEWGTKL